MVPASLLREGRLPSGSSSTPKSVGDTGPLTAPGNISCSEPSYNIHCGGRKEDEYPVKAMKIGTAKRTVEPKRPMTEAGTGSDDIFDALYIGQAYSQMES